MTRIPIRTALASALRLAAVAAISILVLIEAFLAEFLSGGLL